MAATYVLDEKYFIEIKQKWFLFNGYYFSAHIKKKSISYDSIFQLNDLFSSLLTYANRIGEADGLQFSDCDHYIPYNRIKVFQYLLFLFLPKK